MGLSKEQYDEIMRGYYGEQNKNRNERLRRQREISLKVPEIDRISGTVSDAAVTLLKRRLLQGEEIPLSARIMAVADVFDALVSKRSYKDGFPFEKAMDIIREESGTHFDPNVVNAFINASDEVKAVMNSNMEMYKS